MVRQSNMATNRPSMTATWSISPTMGSRITGLVAPVSGFLHMRAHATSRTGTDTNPLIATGTGTMGTTTGRIDSVITTTIHPDRAAVQGLRQTAGVPRMTDTATGPDRPLNPMQIGRTALVRVAVQGLRRIISVLPRVIVIPLLTAAPVHRHQRLNLEAGSMKAFQAGGKTPIFQTVKIRTGPHGNPRRHGPKASRLERRDLIPDGPAEHRSTSRDA